MSIVNDGSDCGIQGQRLAVGIIRKQTFFVVASKGRYPKPVKIGCAL